MYMYKHIQNTINLMLYNGCNQAQIKDCVKHMVSWALSQEDADKIVNIGVEAPSTASHDAQ